MTIKKIRSACCGCYLQCSVIGHVEDGKIIKITGEPDDPTTHGSICPKGANFGEYAHHPDRLKYPLKRIGERGEGKWKRISWDEALDEIVVKLKEVISKYSPLSVVGCPTYGRNAILVPFLNALGSPNALGTTDHCEGASIVSDYATVGNFVSNFSHIPDYKNSNCIFIWGTDPSVASNPEWVGIKKVRKERDVKLVVIDPRKIKPAEQATLYLQIRPGTDGALALAMLNVIINEGLYDKEFVEKWCFGFDKLAERVQNFTPEKVQDITWIPAEKIREVARMYATNTPTCLFNKLGLNQQGNSFYAHRAYASLQAITGNLDVPGGNLLPKRLPGFIHSRDLLGWEVFNIEKINVPDVPPENRELEGKRIGAKRFPLWAGPDGASHDAHHQSVFKAMLYDDPYPVKALISLGMNPVVASPNPEEVIRALKNLDLNVAMEHFMTPSAELADFILPASCWCEGDGTAGEFNYSIFTIIQKLVDPPGEAWSDGKFLIELAKRLNLDKFPKWKNMREFTEWRLKDTGYTFEDLKQKGLVHYPMEYKTYEKRGFKTPTGKVELYSTWCEKFGYDPLPNYREPYEGEIENPELAEKFPLIFTGRREIFYTKTAGHNLSWARKIMPHNTLEIHPDTAKARGIENDDWVWVENSKSKRIRVKAKVTEKIHPKVVSAVACWWEPDKPGPEHGCLDQNINVLASSDPPYDPVAGTPPMKRIPVEVYRD
jgi:anaerobic selenocysteine-containing dehydrogenase